MPKHLASVYSLAGLLGAGALLVACGGSGNLGFNPMGTLDASLGDGGGDGGDVSFGGLVDRPMPADSRFTDGTVNPGDDGPMSGDMTGMDRPRPDGPNLCTSAPDDGYGPEEICGDGLDNDGNGEVDEGCPCAPGSVQRCFAGPPGRRGVGACTDGQQLCMRAGKSGFWGPCQGGILPTAEACDTVDNDCNGCVDDDPSCIEAVLMCPSTGDPRLMAAPLSTYNLTGSDFYQGEAQSWKWEITCPDATSPCASVLGMGGGAAACPQPASPNAMNTSVNFTLSGDYTVKLTIITGDGAEIGCTYVVKVAGPGLRVEMCWDTTGDTDVDLHLHKPRSTRNWFDDADDCYYSNCKAGALFGAPNWGYANTPIANCEGGPEGQQWRDFVGSCRNPRLDIDNISDDGIPENINVDNPRDGDVFRVGVNYFSRHSFMGDTHPVVNIYCGGALKASFGVAPDQVVFNSAATSEAGQFWRVADVETIAVGGNNTDCTVSKLHPAGQTDGYFVTVNSTTY